MGQIDSRDRILQQATQLFIEQGYHRLSMRELAEAAGISKAGIYHHFKDKESLFLAVLLFHLDALAHIVARAATAEGSVQLRVEQMVRAFLARSAEQRAIIRVARQEMAQLSEEGQQTLRQAYHQKFIGKITDLLAEGIERGEFRAMDAQVLTWALLGLLNPYLYPAHGKSDAIDTETISQVLQIFFFGVVTR